MYDPWKAQGDWVPMQVPLDLDLEICYYRCRHCAVVQPFSGVICVEDSSVPYSVKYKEPFTKPPRWCPFALEHLVSSQC